MSKSINKVSDDHSESKEEALSHEVLVAKLAIHPTVLAAHTISHYNKTSGNVGLMELIGELTKPISRLRKGDLKRTEETLAAQIIVLDTLFNSLAVKALQAPGLDRQAVVLKLALQAQRQCCQTIEALSAIKKPPAVTVVRQTNIGQAVQVNNGTADEIPPTNLENELLENTHGERLDSGTQITAITAHQDMAALEELNRSQD
jgi:hypothetical protein